MSTPVNPNSEPWAPDSTHKPGVLGERGSSAFAGSTNFEAYDDTENTGATRAKPGKFQYGDAPTVHSDPSADAFVHRAGKSNQAYEDARRTERSTAES